jgi:hypothetical protein
MYVFYRGTNFNFAGQMQDDGLVQDLTNASVLGTVFDPTGTITYGVLTCTVIGNPTLGIINVSYSGDTTLWPVGKARIDFLLNMPNVPDPIASDPVYFRIAQTPMIG